MLYQTIECDFCGLKKTIDSIDKNEWRKVVKLDDPDRFSRTEDEHICPDCLKKLCPDRFNNVK